MADETPKLTTAMAEVKLGRLLALDVRPRRVGFVVMEKMKVLDWGVKVYGDAGTGFASTVDGKINGLLDLHSPRMVIVLKRRLLGSRAGVEAVMMVADKVRMAARGRAIEFQSVSTSEVRHCFAQYQCGNKHQIATLIAEWFRELAWKLPVKRKPWQSEHHNMTIFDAAAAAITFLCRSVSRTTENE